MKPARTFFMLLMLLLSFRFAAADNFFDQWFTFEVQGAYYIDYNHGYGVDGGFAPPSYSVVSKDKLTYNTSLDPGRDLGTGWGGLELQAVLSYYIHIPMAWSDNALLRDNNMEIKTWAELSPVSLDIGGELSFQPVAFFKLATGLKMGSGWTLIFTGLGRNLPGPDKEDIVSEPLSGIVWKYYVSATLQFDLGAIIPGDWTHLVLAAVPQFEYTALNYAGRDESWSYEADNGENFNGWKYRGTYFIGYQMPLLLEMVGILVETEEYIDFNRQRSTMKDHGWGSDFVFVRFGPLFNLAFTEDIKLTLILQFKTERDYSDATIGYRYFGYRQYEDSYVFLERLVFIMAWKL